MSVKRSSTLPDAPRHSTWSRTQKLLSGECSALETVADTFHGPSDAANGAPVQSTFRPASISSSPSERSSWPLPPNFSSYGLPETGDFVATLMPEKRNSPFFVSPST